MLSHVISPLYYS